MERQNGSKLSGEQYAALAAFRFELRRFLAFSEAAAGAEGLQTQQYQAMLAIVGHQGTEMPTVGLLADRLLIAPHTAAELVTRMEKSGLVTKSVAIHDRRVVQLTLTPQATGLLDRLAAAHLEELTVLEPALTQALRRLTHKSSA